MGWVWERRLRLRGSAVGGSALLEPLSFPRKDTGGLAVGGSAGGGTTPRAVSILTAGVGLSSEAGFLQW
jgi:hypothetical protein